tara:strand:+ start:67 stop:786 length:720 start_codon:yes stop_codon:yes gene_type:complete
MAAIIDNYKDVLDFHRKKGAKNFGPFISVFSYPIAILVVALVRKVKFVTPNFLTSLSLLSLVLGCYIIAFKPGYNWLLFSLIFFYASMIFDSCDGLLARIKNLKSNFGAFYDILSDQIGGGLLFIAVTYRLSFEYENIWMKGVLCVFVLQVNGVADTLINNYKKNAEIAKVLSEKGALFKKKNVFIKFLEKIISLVGSIFFMLFISVIINEMYFFIISYTFCVLVIISKRIFSFYKSGL